ncbi:hypothetical protein [Desulfospira joergensenii]|uniref:hypothetical protein n=1 Tax=Desulfospira joergensenii TaxID=53329 RepID=UPI0003B4D0DF|nr:hypothetical protein [Desulfospira joergensenii]
MKKLRSLFIILFFLTVLIELAYATIREPIVTPLNTSTYTAIVAVYPCPNGFTVWVEDETGYYYATDQAGTNPVEMNGRGAMTFPDSTVKGETIIWIKAKTGTPNFILQPARRGGR